MTRKYWESSGEPDVALPRGWYDVEITAARTIESNEKMIFLDLLVLTGPDKGATTSINLFVPEDGERAVFMFEKKTTAFAGMKRSLAAKGLDDSEYVPALAGALEGFKFGAFLGIQKEGSAYAGTQELQESRPIEGAEAPLAAVEPAAESNGSGGDAEVVELRRKLAEAEAANAPAAAGDDELPF